MNNKMPGFGKNVPKMKSKIEFADVMETISRDINENFECMWELNTSNKSVYRSVPINLL